MKTSANGLKFIERCEGCVLHVYKDQAGLDTIGIGHLITPQEKAAGTFANGITEAQALDLLSHDVQRAEQTVNSLVHVQLTQNQFDVLVDFTFNLGQGALAGSTLLRLLNAGAYSSVPSQLLLWCNVRDPHTGQLVKSPGLLHRRQLEAQLWAS